MLLPHNSVVVVADGEHLKLYRNAGLEGQLQLEPADAPDLHPHGHSSGDHHRSSTANPDRRQQGEDTFAAAVVSWMQSEVLAGRISSVFVIASPKSLGEMRRHYTPALREVLAGEAAKELVSHAVGDIEAAVTSTR